MIQFFSVSCFTSRLMYRVVSLCTNIFQAHGINKTVNASLLSELVPNQDEVSGMWVWAKSAWLHFQWTFTPSQNQLSSLNKSTWKLSCLSSRAFKPLEQLAWMLVENNRKRSTTYHFSLIANQHVWFQGWFFNSHRRKMRKTSPKL